MSVSRLFSLSNRVALGAAAAAMILSGSLALAQDASSGTAPPDPCSNAADDAAMRSCRQDQLDRAKAELKDTVTQLSASLAEGYDQQPKALARAQEDWARFVESECKFTEFESLQGTMGDVYETVCQTALYQARIARLKEILDSP